VSHLNICHSAATRSVARDPDLDVILNCEFETFGDSKIWVPGNPADCGGMTVL